MLKNLVEQEKNTVLYYQKSQFKSVLLWTAISLLLFIFAQIPSTSATPNMKNIRDYSIQLSDPNKIEVFF